VRPGAAAVPPMSTVFGWHSASSSKSSSTVCCFIHTPTGAVLPPSCLRLLPRTLQPGHGITLLPLLLLSISTKQAVGCPEGDQPCSVHRPYAARPGRASASGVHACHCTGLPELGNTDPPPPGAICAGWRRSLTGYGALAQSRDAPGREEYATMLQQLICLQSF
jgi:hypothetical protein